MSPDAERDRAALAGESDVAVAFGFGMATQMRIESRPDGLLFLLADEMERRGLLRPILDACHPTMRDAIQLAVAFDRSRYRHRRKPARAQWTRRHPPKEA